MPEETSPCVFPGAEDQRLGAEQDQLTCGPTESSSGYCQETEILMVGACLLVLPWQPLQNHPLGHLPMPVLLTVVSHRRDWGGSRLNHPLHLYDIPFGHGTDLS